MAMGGVEEGSMFSISSSCSGDMAAHMNVQDSWIFMASACLFGIFPLVSFILVGDIQEPTDRPERYVLRMLRDISWCHPLPVSHPVSSCVNHHQAIDDAEHQKQ